MVKKVRCALLLLIVFFVFSGFNKGQDPSKTQCLDCHADMKAALGKKYLHYPFEAKQCDACHNAATFGFTEQGAALCTVCHRDFVKEGEKAGEKAIVHAPIDQCTTCHNPHSSDNPTLLVEKIPNLCFTCHEGMPAGEKPKSVHPPYEVGECFNCHNPHTSPNRALLIEKPSELCSKCHDTTDSAFQKAHLNLLEKDADCLSCHNGHFSSNKGLILANGHPPFTEGMCDSCHAPSEGQKGVKLVATGTQLCLTCHADIDARLKAKFPHLPATEDCLNCHAPHATPNKSLLTETGAKLCARCHSDTLTQPQGAKIHPPFSDGQCVQCHNPHGSEFTGILGDSEKELCLKCHSKIKEQLEKNHPHTATEQGC